MLEEMVVCNVCSLPTPTHKNKCIHCGASLKKSIYENTIKEITIYVFIFYAFITVYYFLTKAPEIKTIMSLIRIEMISFIVIDLLLLDRSLHRFINLKRVFLYRLHKFSLYVFYTFIKRRIIK